MSKKKDKIQQDDPKQYLAAQKGAGNAKDENLVEEISENFDRFEAWVIENGKYILSVCVILVIGVAVFFTVTHFEELAAVLIEVTGGIVAIHKEYHCK